MATTHKVKWAVSASPIVTVDAVDGASLETNTLHENIRRTLGGSGEASTDGAIDYGGVTDGATNYLQGTSGGVQIGNTNSTFIWVKHSGYQWGGDASTLGSATTDNIQVKVGTEVCAVLRPGEAMVFPLHGEASSSDWTACSDGSDDIAVEAIGLD
jgi:molybdopterin-binding protein